MTENRNRKTTRRAVLASAAAASALGFVPARFAIGQTAKVKLGLMLPYTGTYAALGKNIDDAFRLAIAEAGGTLGGRAVEYVVLDDESEPSKGAENANRLITRDKVDVLVGTVHSGVAMAMVKVATDNETMLIIPNAGAGAATGPMCAPNIFRTSFSNWQPGYAMGKVASAGNRQRAVTVSWDYAAGHESVDGFKDGFKTQSSTIAKEMFLPFPNVEFQAILTEIAALKPEIVYAFFAGAGAVKFVKDYTASGLRTTIPLVGPGFLTDGTLEAQGTSAQGIQTTLHYADGLHVPKDKTFREAFRKATEREVDVYAVQGYDTGQLLVAGLGAVKGDVGARKELIVAMEQAEIDSPRGKFTLSKAHNPVQDMYLRVAEGMQNRFVSIAVKALADPAKGCKMA
jgi:branched-chain amino acid transport system substrate-binding protein